MPTLIHRLGVATAGDHSVLALPHDWKPNGTRTAVILCVGFSDIYTAAFNQAAAQPLVDKLTSAGYPVVVSDLGGTVSSGLWGNSDAQSRIGALRSYVQGASIGAKAGPVFGVGFSMGALGLLNYTGNNPTNVAGLVVGCPVVDVQLVKNNGSYSGLLDSAYSGGWSEGTYGATTNPKTMATAGKYAGKPIRAYYAPDDTLISPTSVTGFVSIVGSSAAAIATGNLGHSWPVLTSGTRPDDIVAYLSAISA